MLITHRIFKITLDSRTSGTNFEFLKKSTVYFITKYIFLTLPEAIENLTLTLQGNGDLRLKTVTLVRF